MRAITPKDLRDLMIVRCKNCKWCFKAHDEDEEYLVCGVLGCDIPDDYFFCAYGEVKDDEL